MISENKQERIRSLGLISDCYCVLSFPDSLCSFVVYLTTQPVAQCCVEEVRKEAALAGLMCVSAYEWRREKLYKEP
jgi:hypothetical protein